MEPPIVRMRRNDFMCVCEDIGMPYEKANLLCNCYIHKITIESVYHITIEESIQGIVRLLNIYGKSTEPLGIC